ncbi:hypothetical protein EYF80_006337 [Liparis tanakae]|uniref:Uncharacterized protein n=1 Tax=Liparis tanakae TaxID=230148 RepID=A0A4Z2IZP7_9TELE|nr:hypothetical protein EYF80_006337 [Liparis tanakae]
MKEVEVLLPEHRTHAAVIQAEQRTQKGGGRRTETALPPINKAQDIVGLLESISLRAVVMATTHTQRFSGGTVSQAPKRSPDASWHHTTPVTSVSPACLNYLLHCSG